MLGQVYHTGPFKVLTETICFSFETDVSP